MDRLHTGAVGRRQLHERQLLDHLEAKPRATQRSLASELGIALGLTNLLIRRLVRKGWIKVKRVSPRRIAYLVTPAGIAAKAELTRQYFLGSLLFYRDTRERMRERLAVLSAELYETSGYHDVVFFGAGDVAEVAYVCLDEAALRLIGVVDDRATKPFLHVPVHAPSELSGTTLAGRPFSRLIVMPLQDEAGVRDILARQRVPPESVFWL